MRSAISTMPTGDFHPLLGKAREGEWAQRAWLGESQQKVQEASQTGRLSLDQWRSREGEGFHPVKKGTFKLLTVRLKIASSKENLGGGGSWRVLKIVSDSELRALVILTLPPSSLGPSPLEAAPWAPAKGLL